MSASTMNPPLPFTKDAIIGNFQIHATNGPAYVQLQATRALARLKGMYEEARLMAREAFNTKHQDTHSHKRTLSKAATQPPPSTTPPTCRCTTTACP